MPSRRRCPLPGSLEVRRQSDGRVVAEICRDGVLMKHVRRSQHLLWRLNAWAFDRVILREAEAASVHWVKVVDTEANKTYWASLSDFGRYGQPFDYGHGPQVGLPLRHWTVGVQPPIAAKQLMLFTEVMA